MSFGERFKKRREELGLTQIEVAEKLGITKGAVGNYETEFSSPKADILFKVFDVLQCDANYLFQDEMAATKQLSDSESDIDCLEYAKKYQLLNEAGRAKSDAYIDDLLDNPKYQAVGKDGLTSAEKERCSHIGREMGMAVKEILKDNEQAVFNQNRPVQK